MAERTYESESIAVHWNSTLCIHSARCLKALPEVFDAKARPWVRIEAADADAIARAVEQCPTAALTYTRLDGAAGETAPETTTVVPRPNGPLLLRGRLEVNDVDGETFLVGPRAALCRCGASQNQPFCDLSHKRIGFEDNPRVVSPTRSDAENPQQVVD